MSAGEQWTRASLEEFVARRFCAHLGDGYRVQEQREEPDFIIADCSGAIGLEITRYRTPGPKNQAEALDQRIKEFVLEHWLSDDTVNHWIPCLYYRLATSRQGNSFYRLPRTDAEKQAFVDDLKGLVRRLTPTESHLRLYFVDDHKAGVLERLGDDMFVREHDYPTLSHFCNEVGVHYARSARVGLISSNFNAGRVGIEEDVLGQLVESKLERLPTYRENLPGVPIWLLIYNEGNTISRRIESLNYRETIVETLTRYHEVRDERFDAVWWGKNVMLDGASSPEFIEISGSSRP